MRRFLLLLIVLPFVEMYLLILIGRAIGFWPTIGALLLSAMLGTMLAKFEGLRVWRSYREAADHGRMPDEGILGGLLVLIGGLLLVIPGPITDLAGLVLLLPPARKRIAAALRSRIERKLHDSLLNVVGTNVAIGGNLGARMNDEPDVVMHPFQYEERRRYAGREPEIVDTEGFEVQTVNLLPAPVQTVVEGVEEASDSTPGGQR